MSEVLEAKLELNGANGKPIQIIVNGVRQNLFPWKDGVYVEEPLTEIEVIEQKQLPEK